MGWSGFERDIGGSVLEFLAGGGGYTDSNEASENTSGEKHNELRQR